MCIGDFLQQEKLSPVLYLYRWFNKATLSFTLRINSWVLTKKPFCKRDDIQLFSADATVLFRKKMPTKSWKKTSQKLLRNIQKHFLHFCPELPKPGLAKMDHTEEFMIQNVAYRPTVYKTGGLSILISWMKVSISNHCALVSVFERWSNE